MPTDLELERAQRIIQSGEPRVDVPEVPAPPTGIPAPGAADPETLLKAPELMSPEALAQARQRWFRDELAVYGLTPEEAQKRLATMREELEAVRRARATELATLAHPEAPLIQALRQAAETPARVGEPSREALERVERELPSLEALRAELAPRPFLAGPERTALQRVTHGLGLLATLIGGIASGAPRAALAAWTGALEGWQQGEQERAERAWRLFQAQHLRSRQTIDAIWRAWQIAKDQAGANLTRLEVLFRTELARLGLLKETEELLTRPVAELEGTLSQAKRAADQTARDVVQLERAKASHDAALLLRLLAVAEARRARHERAEERREAHEERRRERLLLDPRVQRGLADLGQARGILTHVLPQLRWATDYLASKGLLLEEPGFFAKISRDFREVISRDPLARTAMEIIRRYGTALVVGYERLLGATAGVLRLAKVAEAEILDLHKVPRPVLHSLWNQIERAATKSLELTRERLTRAGVPEDLITLAEAEARLEDLPDVGAGASPTAP